jgi:hypothetical protein
MKAIDQKETKEVLWARAIAMWAFRQDGLSLAQIGLLFGKARETVRSNYLRCLLNEYKSATQARNRNQVFMAWNDRLQSKQRVLDLDDPELVWLRSHTMPDIVL